MMSERRAAAISRAGLAALHQAEDVDLAAKLRDLLQAFSADDLPNPLCCDRGGVISPEDWSIDLIDANREDNAVRARLGLFFTEVVGGCNCHDDPARYSEHRLLTVLIDGATGDLVWSTADAET